MTEAEQHRDHCNLEKGGSSQRIIAFAPRAVDAPKQAPDGGNPCLLLMTESVPEVSPQPTGEATVCQSWLCTHNHQPTVAVTCFTSSGLAIKCCGHGLLAAAYSWQKHLQRSEVPLLMGQSLIPSWHEQDTIWLSFDRLATTPCPVPHWATEIFPNQSPPVACATCGGEQGYLILQWPDAYDLKQLAPALDYLAKHSQRALICTSAQPAGGDGAIQLRYFAPQYGVPEDTATGSAVRVLASYWLPRFNHLEAQQCSPVGGWLRTRSAGSYTHVGGHCRIGD